VLALVLARPSAGQGQVTREDYQRADSLAELLPDLVVGEAEEPHWLDDGSGRFWYRVSVEGGDRFVLVEPDLPRKGPAFDHDRLAAALNEVRDDTLTALTLPFRELEYRDSATAIEFEVADSTWRCGLADYRCENRGPGKEEGRDRPYPWQAGPGQRWRLNDGGTVASPDGRLEAFIHNHNLAVREPGSEEHTLLSREGSEGNAYALSSIVWSPESSRVAAYRVVPGYERRIHYVVSSPEDQLQPRDSSLLYAKPGDVLDREMPVVFDVETGEQILVDDGLFPNAYRMSDLEWREDGRHLTFEYNQRGHEVYRVIEIDAVTGSTRAVISEEPETFFDYSQKRFRRDIDDGREILWMSERSGWNHLWLYDGETGRVKNQVTRGEWAVRGIDSVDVEGRRVFFRASGMNPDEDPYFVHHYSIGFDGDGLIAYTPERGDHDVSFSPDGRWYVDRWSRIDRPPTAVLRRTSDQAVVMELETADASSLLATGWSYPEVFVAKGRDGVTDIWGIIIRPIGFDPSRRYPVVESIYAGPHGSFVPKSFTVNARRQALAELGFVVVQIDGMGTNNRSKAFHDVAWKNLGDAGFPDRILWHRAVADRYGWYDIDRMGIYGTSAGGQNAMGALLFHPDFYDVAVSAAGCHDNRMDKIWWNEAWMGWPLGPQYSESSNVDNAWRLEGELLLILPEVDTNVDPASTLQVVDALIEAEKDFDFLMVPGADHGTGGEYGVRKRNDFFVEHLLGQRPPRWNRLVDRKGAGGR
jgi:dipeptidyl aminopeptidase/acylaminoacyl peptidase